MKNSILILLMCLSVAAMAQDKAAIESALQTFDDASDVIGMQKAVKEMKAVSDKDPNDWYSAYWTSFFYSQTGRLTQQSSAYYDSAQMYFDKANQALAKPNNVEASDFHALQSLIYNLKSADFYSQGNFQKGQQLDQQSNLELNQALKFNENNPRVHLLSGTDLISNGIRQKSNPWVLAGKSYIERAKALFESQKPASSIAPSWGSGWVNFWLSRAKID